MGKILQTILIQLGTFIFIDLLIIFLPKLITKNYWSIEKIIIFIILVLFIEIVIFFLLIAIIPDLRNEMKGQDTTVQSTPYADMQEIVNYNIDYFKNSSSNPVNIKLASDFRQERILSVGKEPERTEVCILKFIDVNPLKAKYIYYVANRVKEINKLGMRQYSFQPSIDEEKKIMMELANSLASNPQNMRETEIKIERSPMGEIVRTEKTRQSMVNDNQGDEL